MRLSEYSRITDVAMAEENVAARRLREVLNWAAMLIVDDMATGGNGDNALTQIAHLMPGRLLKAHMDSAIAVGMGAFKIARMLTDAQARRNIMVRGKAELELAFNDDAMIQRYVEVGIEDWLTETARMETETSIINLSSILRDAWSIAGDNVGDGMRSDINAMITYFQRAVEAQTEARAILMARTSMIWSANEAAEISYRQAGLSQKQWLTAHDELLCPFCAAMDGKRIDAGARYANKGDRITGNNIDGESVEMMVGIDVSHPPLHPHCRCALVPVLT